mmetsp:Transcript_59907/g.115569  ORF Transcript_59907/g.115569 Transcript_59907/m.115569 type:complete len:85 (+) Transcript_59907:66-320(+)
MIRKYSCVSQTCQETQHKMRGLHYALKEEQSPCIMSASQCGETVRILNAHAVQKSPSRSKAEATCQKWGQPRNPAVAPPSPCSS